MKKRRPRGWCALVTTGEGRWPEQKWFCASGTSLSLDRLAKRLKRAEISMVELRDRRGQKKAIVYRSGNWRYY